MAFFNPRSSALAVNDEDIEFKVWIGVYVGRYFASACGVHWMPGSGRSRIFFQHFCNLDGMRPSEVERATISSFIDEGHAIPVRSGSMSSLNCEVLSWIRGLRREALCIQSIAYSDTKKSEFGRQMETVEGRGILPVRLTRVEVTVKTVSQPLKLLQCMVNDNRAVGDKNPMTKALFADTKIKTDAVGNHFILGKAFPSAPVRAAALAVGAREGLFDQG